MADTAPRRAAFEVIEDDEAPIATVAPPAAPKRDTALLVLALKTLSQRAIAAVADLFTLATVGSAFWLFFAVKDSPTVLQIVLAAIYSAFVLAANWIVRRG